MSVKGMVASAVERVGSQIVGNKANKAILTLPKNKQDKVRGMLMVATAVVMLVSGLKLLNRGSH